MVFLLNPATFSGQEFFDGEFGQLGQFVKSSKRMQGVEEILLPGEPEVYVESFRRSSGSPIDQTTWENICHIASLKNVPIPEGA